MGGELSDRKSMSFPNKVLQSDSTLSEQDKEDLLFGIRNDVDFVAASFVSCKQDLLDLRGIPAARNGGEDIDIIAKIENRAGVDNIEEICERLRRHHGRHAATSAWRSRSRSCPPFRSTSSRNAACSASVSSRPRKCLNP